MAPAKSRENILSALFDIQPQLPASARNFHSSSG